MFFVIDCVSERERERDPHFKLVLSASTQVAGFTSSFLIIYKPSSHFTLSMTSSFSVQSDWYAPLVSSMSYSVAHTLFFLPLQSPMLFSKHHHYPFSKHAHTIILHMLWLVHPNPAKSISSWLLFSIIFTPHIALIIAFSVLKIAFSFSFRPVFPLRF